MSEIDPISVPTTKPADAAWPDYPSRGTDSSVPAIASASGFLRVDTFAVCRLPNNHAVIAVASQDKDLLAAGPTADPFELARREATRIYLVGTTLASDTGSPVLCGRILGPAMDLYCTYIPFTSQSFIDISVPEAVWADTTYTHVWVLDGELKGHKAAIDSRPDTNVWRILNLGTNVQAPLGQSFGFVAFGGTAPTAPNLSGVSPLPHIYVDGMAVPACNPQVASNANIVPSPTHPTIYVVAEAPVSGAYQLFLYSYQYGSNAYGWKQLTFDGENRNAKGTVDTDGNLHLVWETNRCPVDNTVSGTVKFAAFGDFGVNDQNELNVSILVKTQNPDFILALGDNNYTTGSAADIDNNIGKYYSEFIGNYKGSFGSGSVQNRFWPCLGNHDWGNVVPTVHHAQPYLDYFNLPGNERYYTFKQGPVQFFAISSDPNEPDGNTSTSKQALWLRDELEKSTAPWKVVFFHHAAYSSGNSHGSTAYMQWPFGIWGADVVFSGHDHVYERIITGGVTYITSGLGGQSRNGFSSTVAGSQLRYSSDWGSTFVTATPTSFNIKFVNIANSVVDDYTMTKAAPAADITKTYAGLMYGVLGSSSRGLVNEAFVSAVDKQAQLIVDLANVAKADPHDKTRLATSYLDSIVTVGTPTAMDLRDLDSYGSPTSGDDFWLTATEIGGVASIVDDGTLNLSGNAASQRFGAFACLNHDENGNYITGDFEQFHYQISFKLNLTSIGVSVLSGDNIRTLFDTFKSQFFVTTNSASNTAIYYKSSNANIYTIDEPEYIYDGMIPVVGSYKYPPVCLDGSLSSPPARLRHFVFGVIPEKVRFRAANTMTSSEQSANPPPAPPSSSSSNVQFQSDITQDQYTGKYKLAILFETSANLGDDRLGAQKAHTVRRLGGTFLFNTDNDFKIAVSYAHLYDEQVKMRRSVDAFDLQEQDVRFTGSVIVAANDVVQGAENFIPDFSDGYYSFDVGFGCPTIGEWRVQNPVPFNAHKWHNLSVTMALTNVVIGPHSILPTDYTTWLSKHDRDTSKMMVFSASVDALSSLTTAQSMSLGDDRYALTFGMDRSLASLSQIPFTFEGTNRSPSVVIDGCDKLHVAYQSNRDNNWEIYYTSSLDQSVPFRFDTRITNAPGDSLNPSIGVDQLGRRLIAWHDSRDGTFQIYSARSLVPHSCRTCDDQTGFTEYVGMLGDRYNNPNDPYDPYYGDICRISFQFQNTSGTNNYFHFRLSFYQDAEMKRFVKSIDSSIDPSSWTASSFQLPFDGIFMNVNDTVTVTFDAAKEDDLSGELFYVQIEYNDGSLTALPETIAYYCPKPQLSRCTLPGTYTNSSGGTQTVHFTVTVYKDEAMTQAVMSASTQSDQTGWTAQGDRFPSAGLSLPSGKTASVYYDPNFVPVELFGSQNEHTITSLLCNVKYWVKVTATVGSTPTDVETYAVICDCADTKASLWRKDRFDNEWLSSAQGSMDTRITATAGNALFPCVAGSQDSMLYVAWEDQRYSDRTADPQIVPDIYFGAWDSDADRFYCSGQGGYDKRLTSDGTKYLKPKVLVTSLQLPAFFYQTATLVKRSVKSLYITPATPDRTSLGEDGVFNSATLPYATCLSISVAKDFVVQQYHADSDTPISRVKDCLIKLDISGPLGVYAVRLKNEEENDWSDWLQILPELPNYPDTGTGSRGDGTLRSHFDAYFIADNRFTVPWVLSPNNGTKTVYCQLLTHDGSTPTFSQQIIAVYDELSYRVEFFAEGPDAATGAITFSGKPLIPLPQYNGYPVVSTKRLVAKTDGGAVPTIAADDVSTIGYDTANVSNIYVRVTFDDVDALSKKLSLSAVDKFNDLGDPTFDVIYQGTKRYAARTLTQTDEGVYIGSFPVTKSDGYHIKDGLGVIVVHVPTPCSGAQPFDPNACNTDSPEDIRAQQKVDADARVIAMETFRYKYNQSLLCSFTSNQCVDGVGPAEIDITSDPPTYSGPLSCNVTDWNFEPAAEKGLLRDGGGLTTYYRESDAFTLDFSDSRITRLVIGKDTRIEGLLFLVPGQKEVTVVAGDNGVTYTMPEGTIALGQSAHYRFAPTPARNGTSAKTFGSFSISEGDTSVPVNGSMGIEDVTDDLNPFVVSTTANTSIAKADLSGLMDGDLLTFRYVHVSTGISSSCLKGVRCAGNCDAAPLPPVDVDASVDTNYTITLDWTAPGVIDGYDIEYSVSNSEYVPLAIVESNSYTLNSGLESDTQYCFRIRAYNACGYSDYSNIACCTTNCLSPSRITGFTATVISDTQVNLAWTVASGVSSYMVMRKTQTGGDSFTDVSGTLSAATGTYSDTTASPGTAYYYVVVASNACDIRTSDTAAVTTSCTVPVKVATITVTMPSAAAAKIDWSSTANSTSYLVQRRPDDGVTVSFTDIATVTHPTVTYTDSGLTAGVAYCYRVVARNVCGDGTPSDEACETLLDCGSPSTTFDWEVARQHEPYHDTTTGSSLPVYSPPTDAWIHYSGDQSISVADHRITRVSFGPDVSLDDILVLMKAGETITQIWSGTPLDPITFTLPNNCILFSNDYGYYINKDKSDRNHSPQKTFNETGTSHTLILPAGNSSNDKTGNINDFASAGFYCVNFTDGVSKNVLQERGFIDTNGNFNFNFAHILCGVGHLLNFSLTCSGDGDGGGTDPEPCTPKNAATNLAASVLGTTATLTWTDTNAGSAAYIIERQENGGGWDGLVVTDLGETTYTDTAIISGIDYCYRVKVKDCTAATDNGVCDFMLYLSDLPNSAHPTRDLKVRVSGVGLSYTVADDAINIHSVSGGVVHVTLVTNRINITPYHQLSPRVNGTIVNWDSGNPTIEDIRLHSLAEQTEAITLSAGDRLQIYLSHTGAGDFEDGDHDDGPLRSTWTIFNCTDSTATTTPASATICLEAGCPATCVDCCDSYVVTVSGASSGNGTYTLTKTGCVWTDGTEFNFIRKIGQNWVMTIGNDTCINVWTAICNGCPPTSGWSLDGSTTCGGSPAYAITRTDCGEGSSSTDNPDPCNFFLNSAGGNEGYDQSIDISSSFVLASIVRFVFIYDTYSVPDRVVVTSASGLTLLDSGCCVTGQPSHCYGTQGERTSFFDCTIADSPLRIQVIPNCNATSHTGWIFRMHCASTICTPSTPLAPIGSQISPVSSCTLTGTDLLWSDYTISPSTCNCGYSVPATSTGDLVYQGNCLWESVDTPPWQLSFDGSTWTLTRGTSPVLWTGTRNAVDPVGTYTRSAGVDPLLTREVTVACQTCPSDCSGCCQIIEMTISGADSTFNGVWHLARYLDEPFWSSEFTGGSRPGGATTVHLTIRCDGFNWIINAVGDNHHHFTYVANLTECPPLVDGAWYKQSAPGAPSLSFECLDCITDCTACPSYSLTTSGFANCVDFNDTFALVKTGCEWDATGAYGMTVTLSCIDHMWTLKIEASPTRYAVAYKPGLNDCPPVGTWDFTTIGCGNDNAGTGTLS